MLSRHRADTPVAWTKDKTTTAAEMRAHVVGFASLLEPAREGEELLVICRDRYRFAVALQAAWERGYSVALPPNPQPETIRSIRSRPGVVTVIHDVDGIDKGIDVRDEGVVATAKAAVGKVPFTPLADPPPGRRIATVYTSGSTGDHVPCPKTAGQLLGEARMQVDAFGVPVGARILPMVPAYHIYGLLWGVLIPLTSGASFHRHTPLHASEVAGVGPIDVLVTVPAHLRGLLVAAPGELPAVSRVISSAAPLPPRVANAVRDRFGWTVTEIFGSSETGGIAWRESGGQGPWTPLPQVSIDADADGRMMLDSPWLSPDDARPFVGSDRVQLNGDGTFLHQGRADGVLKIGGVRVSLAEVERRLLDIDGVRDAGVLGVAVDGPRGYEIHAAVVAPGLDRDAIRAALRGWLAPVAMPRRLKLVDALPRTESGKLRRQDLAALFAKREDA
ncbi:MAG: class I adenylate-forming enzyme family protein [Sandaracinaceae bacterium]